MRCGRAMRAGDAGDAAVRCVRCVRAMRAMRPCDALRRARRGQGKLLTPDGNAFEGAARGWRRRCARPAETGLAERAPLAFPGTFVHNKLTGPGRHVWPDGRTYTGPPTKVVQGWPKLRANFRAVLGIFSQSVGPSLAIWANPVHFSLAEYSLRRTPNEMYRVARK